MTRPIHTRPKGRSGAAVGLCVVLLTGLAAVVGIGANYRMEAIDWVLLAFIVIVTAGGLVALARLIRRNPGAIGEARFDTSHPDDPPADQAGL